MNKVANVLLATLTMCIAGCASELPGASLVTASDGGKTVVVTDSPGGNVAAFEQAFGHWSQIPGVKVEIRHWCASACTQLLSYFEPEQICLSPGARLGFHSATANRAFTPWISTASGVSTSVSDTNSISTLIMFAAYPRWIQYHLSSAGVMGLGAGNPSAVIGANEFWHRGYGVCSNTTQTADARGPG